MPDTVRATAAAIRHAGVNADGKPQDVEIASISVLTVDDIDEIRRAVVVRDDLPAEVEQPGLAAAVELACTAWHWRALGESNALEAFERWASAHGVVREAWHALEGRRPFAMEAGSASMEVRSVTNLDAAARFSKRFSMSMRELGGADKTAANALGGALAEMIDNVFQHSTAVPEVAAHAVMAFEVTGAGAFSFVVADVGRGLLASLRANPRWSSLDNDEAALTAILHEHASRRSSGPGTGFRDTVRALADVGQMRLRTGSSYLSVEGRCGSREAALGTSAELIGVQVVVSSRSGP